LHADGDRAVGAADPAEYVALSADADEPRFRLADFRLLETKLQHERELREAAERATAAALEKQAAEYERRLAELNGAHARSLQDRADFVQRSIYEQTQKELATWKLQVTAEQTIMAERLRADQVAAATALATSQRTVNLTLTGFMVILAIANFVLARMAH